MLLLLLLLLLLFFFFFLLLLLVVVLVVAAVVVVVVAAAAAAAVVVAVTQNSAGASALPHCIKSTTWLSVMCSHRHKKQVVDGQTDAQAWSMPMPNAIVATITFVSPRNHERSRPSRSGERLEKRCSWSCWRYRQRRWWCW